MFRKFGKPNLQLRKEMTTAANDIQKERAYRLLNKGFGPDNLFKMDYPKEERNGGDYS